jgi:dTDP-glucose pyrophosphorylase
VSVSRFIRKAVVLAAGKGTRMGDLTRSLPKPLLPVAGRPILHHVLERLAAAGVEEVALVIGYHGDRIRASLAGHPLRLHFIEQTAVNGTGSAALLAREFAGDDPFLLTFGDILSTAEDYLGMAAALTAAASAVLGVQWAEDPCRGAAVYEQDGRVLRIVEKPAPGTSATHWNSAGLYAFTTEIFEELSRIPLSPRGEYELTSAVELLLAHGREVRMYAVSGPWLDVGRPEDLAAAEALLKKRPE